MTNEKPVIYCFSSVPLGHEGPAYALAQDGTVLGSHYCGHESYIVGDLSRPDRLKVYDHHYPDGYEMEFVPANNIATHDGLQAALKIIGDAMRRATRNQE